MGSTRYDWLPRSDRAPGGGYLYMGTPLYKVRPVALVIFRARNWSILGLFRFAAGSYTVARGVAALRNHEFRL